MRKKSFVTLILFAGVFFTGIFSLSECILAGMSDSSLSGKYLAITQQTNNWGSRALATFDGKGAGSAKTLESTNGLTNDVPFIYNVDSDGTCTLTPSGWISGNGIISPDGKVASLIYFDDGFSQLVFAIKKSSGMSNSKLKGEYIAVDQGTDGESFRMLITFDGKGKGTYKALKTNFEEKPSGSLSYSVSSDGLLTFTVPGIFTDNGIVSSDGKIATIFTNNEGKSEFVVMIRKSSGMSNSDLIGEFIFVEQNTDDEGVRFLATFDGKGNGTFQHLENSFGQLVSGAFTYNVSSDGSFTITPKGWLTGNGIVSSDGNVATQIFFDDDYSSMMVGIKKSASSNPDNDGDGYTENQGDCDDTDNTIYPGAIEICDDGTDQDCDGYDETCIDGPTAPSGLAVNAVSYRKILLRWTDKSTDEDGFKIERKKKFCSDDTYSWTQIATVSGDNKYEDVENFDLDMKYSYRVRAYKGYVNSAYSNCGATITASASGTPSAPVNLVATVVSSSTVNLVWDEWSSSVTGFKIYRDVNGADSWALHATTGSTAKNYSDVSASGSQSGSGYCYYVQACNDNGCSPPTYPVCIPFKPTNLSATAGSGKIILAWEDTSHNERGFEIYRKTGECSSSSSWEKVKSAGIGRTTVADNKDLVSGMTYSYKIRAYYRSWGIPYVYGYSDWSDCVSVTAP